MVALDLFCGGGGVSMGLHLAGFELVGVDIKKQKRYPFKFIQADARQFPLDGFDFIWASPPCQRYCSYSKNLGTAENHPDLIPEMRARLTASGSPWVIENVEGAPLKNALMLCGTMFGLKVIRHRYFESNWDLGAVFPPADCRHRGDEIGVYGNGTPVWHLEKRGGVGVSVAEKREAMGIDWMIGAELAESIPPAYSEFIAREFLSSCATKTRNVLRQVALQYLPRDLERGG